MADTDRPHSLRLWSIATFHAVSFVGLLVVGVHWSGSLASVLGRLDTLTGFGVFFVLWATTWCATRVGLRSIGSRVDEATASSVIFSMTVAGGWNGVAVLLLMIVVALVFALARGVAGLSLIPVLFFTSVIGSLLAFTVGAVVGLLYGLADAALLRFGALLFRWAEERSSS